MASLDEWAEAVAATPGWNDRVAMIRKIPKVSGTAQHQAVYARVAERVFVPNLKPDFAYVHWPHAYELEPFAEAYGEARTATDGFRRVGRADLERAIRDVPRSLQVFRLLLGLTGAEFAEACTMVAGDLGTAPVGKTRVDAFYGAA